MLSLVAKPNPQVEPTPPNASSEGEPTIAFSRAAYAVLAALALAYALYVGRGGAQPIPLILLTVAIVLAAYAAFTPKGKPLPTLSFGRIARFGILAQFALLFVWPVMNPLALARISDYLPYWFGLATALPFALMAAFSSRPGRRWLALLTAVVIHVAIGTWCLQTSPDPLIDVWSMQVEGANALTSGTNPYLPIYENIHGADTTYYGPGLVVDGKLTIGFPYPPLSLIAVIPAATVLGDPRYTYLAAIGLTVLVLAAIRPGTRSSSAAMLYLFTPWTFLMVVGSWTEPLAILLIALVLLAAVRAPRRLGLAVGMLIAIKQYLVLALPLAALLLAKGSAARWRLVWQASTVALVITLPFALWNMEAFLWSTVGSLAVQVFRADSLSYLAVLPGDLGPRLSIVGFILLGVVGLVAWFRGSRTPFGFAATLSVSLLVFFAFSRQGSGNYHFAVIGALLCAAAASESAKSARGSMALGNQASRPIRNS